MLFPPYRQITCKGLSTATAAPTAVNNNAPPAAAAATVLIAVNNNAVAPALAAVSALVSPVAVNRHGAIPASGDGLNTLITSKYPYICTLLDSNGFIAPLLPSIFRIGTVPLAVFVGILALMTCDRVSIQMRPAVWACHPSQGVLWIVRSRGT